MIETILTLAILGLFIVFILACVELAGLLVDYVHNAVKGNSSSYHLYEENIRDDERRNVLRLLDDVQDSDEFYFEKIRNWLSDRKISENSTPMAQYRKFVEEAEELLRDLKRLEREGATDEVVHAVMDDLGDVWVTLVAVAETGGFSLRESAYQAYNEIKDRKGYLNEEGIFIKETA